MFLKLSGSGFNEQLLEEDFVRLADMITDAGVQGFLYRDFQSRNILIRDNTPWFIDFQGGRKGSPYYDVASLLLDPYVELEKPLHDRLLDFYFTLVKEKINTGHTGFLSTYPVFGIVRLLQALGAYGFRGLHERKPNFIESIPPAVRQLNRILDDNSLHGSFPELAAIAINLRHKWTGKTAETDNP